MSKPECASSAIKKARNSAEQVCVALDRLMWIRQVLPGRFVPRARRCGRKVVSHG